MTVDLKTVRETKEAAQQLVNFLKPLQAAQKVLESFEMIATHADELTAQRDNIAKEIEKTKGQAEKVVSDAKAKADGLAKQAKDAEAKLADLNKAITETTAKLKPLQDEFGLYKNLQDIRVKADKSGSELAEIENKLAAAKEKLKQLLE